MDPADRQAFENPLRHQPVRMQFKRLVEQQFWLWGCDVRCPDGNLLIEMGFTKIPPPETALTTISRYSALIGPEQTLHLWGFGLAVEDRRRGLLFLSRHKLQPRCGDCGADLSTFWNPLDFEILPHPRAACDHARTWPLMGDLLHWIARYEEEVIARAGIEHREQAVAGWHRPVGPAWTLPDRWRELADTVWSSPRYGDGELESASRTSSRLSMFTHHS